MKTNQNLKKILAFALFIAILIKVFLSTTYLFRNTGINRDNLTGIGEFPVDMVYVGGSAAFVYWQAMKAWNDYGITSYTYATNSIQAESIEYFIKESQRLQKPNKPQLYVLDARAFQYWTDDFSTRYESGFRNGSDSMDAFSPNRLKMISAILNNRIPPEDIDVPSLFFDIAKYHTNTKDLRHPGNWRLLDNRTISTYNGFEFINKYSPLSAPSNFETEEFAELDDGLLRVLDHLLKYCQSQKLQVLFVVSPYYITADHQKVYNSIREIVVENGFQFLNANDYLEEMAVDFSTDFYNSFHVNCFGAEKYTAFLEKYIAEIYSLPDHRDNPDYESWNTQFEQFTADEQVFKSGITAQRLNMEAGHVIAKELRQTTDLVRWATLAQDSRFCLLMAGKGDFPYPENRADRSFLATWNLNRANYQNSTRVVSGTSILATNPDEHTAILRGTIGIEMDAYCIDNESGDASIQLKGREQSLQGNGLNIVVYDQNYRAIVDSVTVQSTENGQLILCR